MLRREMEARSGVFSRMVDALRRYFEPKLKRVEQTFLSAHVHKSQTSESYVWAGHDSPPSPSLEKGRRYLLDHISPRWRDPP